jgi:hypothetical protein
MGFTNGLRLHLAVLGGISNIPGGAGGLVIGGPRFARPISASRTNALVFVILIRSWCFAGRLAARDEGQGMSKPPASAFRGPFSDCSSSIRLVYPDVLSG